MLRLKKEVNHTNIILPILVGILLIVLLMFIINSIKVVNEQNKYNFAYAVKVRDTTEQINKIIERAQGNIQTASSIVYETYDVGKIKDAQYNLNYVKQIDALTKAMLINTPNVNGAWFVAGLDAPHWDETYTWYVYKNNKIINYRLQLTEQNRNNRRPTPEEDPYYFDAIKSKNIVWSDIYTDADSKIQMMTISRAIFKKNKLIGVVGIDISIDNLKQALKNMQKVVTNSEIFFLNKDNKIILYQLPPNEKYDAKFPNFIELFRKNNSANIVEYYDKNIKKTAILLKLSNKYNIITVFQNYQLYYQFNRMYEVIYIIFIIMVILAIANISSKRRILRMNKLLENEAIKLRTVIDSSPNTIVIKNLNGVYVDCNDAFLKMTKRDREYFIGKTANETFDEERAKEINEDDNYVIQNKKILTKEFNLIDSTGNQVFVEKYIVPLLGYKNELKGILIIAFDITKQQQEKELLKEAKENAEKMAQMKSNFLANMSHEIRTPMNGVLGFLQLLQETETTPEQAEFIEDAQKSSELLLQIINDILDFSKMEANKLQLDEISFDLHLIIDDITIMAASMAQNKNLELNSLICSDIPQNVIGDPIRIKQILTNLINNAIKFTIRGEVTICVSQVDETSDTCIINFDIKDTGIGIEKDKISQIFEEFSQADASTTRKFGGTGLGLAITKKLIRLMNGSITVESEIGRGTTFTVSLPLKKDKDAENRNPILLNGLQILAVDSNQTNLKIIDYYLSRTNCIVHKAICADDVIKIINNEKNNISVVLIDEKMNNEKTSEISALIRNNDNYKDVPFIQCSSLYHLTETMNKPIIFAEYLAKPISKNDLISAISRVTNNQISKKESNSNNNINSINFNSNAKILVVEDNEINLKLLQRILIKHGLSCDNVTNGKDAIEAFKANDYDLIFMDCQIPIISGYEATKEIRKIENGQKHTPIVAMTANVLAQDKSKCYESGMDDYISKPINTGHLFNVISKYIDSTSEMLVYTGNNDNEKNKNDDANDIIRAIMEHLDFTRDDAEMIFSEYITILPQLINEIETAIEKDDFEALKRTSHKLKGSSANLRVKEIASISEEIENGARENKDKDYHSLVKKIKDYTQKF